MPIRLADLTSKTRTVNVPYDGESIAVTYYPGRLTPATESRLNKANEDNRPASGVAAELALIMASWDVLDDKGKPEPVTAELLAQMPTRLLLAIVGAIGTDARPNALSAAS